MNNRFSRLGGYLACVVFCFYCCSAAAQHPVAALPDTIPHPDSLSDHDVSVLTSQLAGQAKFYETKLTEITLSASGVRDAAEQTWKIAKQDSLTAKSALDSLAGILKTARNAEKQAQKKQKQATQTVAFTDKVAGMEMADQRKNLRKAFKQVKELDALLNPPAAADKTEKPIAEVIGKEGVGDSPLPADSTSIAETASYKRKSKEKKSEKTGPKYKPYDPATDIMLNPPRRPCALAVNTRDEFSGETYRETTREELFRFSNDLMKKYLPAGQPHIICEAALSAGGGNINLHLHFSIRDANARKAFGSLSRNSVAILKFLDGTTFNANNLRNDEGAFDADGKVFSCRGQYALDPAVLKKLRKNELDKIRVSWSAGYEDYEVQNIDLLIRHAECLFD